MVVSEIMDKLSPNIAPHITAPAHNAMLNPVLLLISTAMGVNAATVPTDVPMDTEIKHPMTKRPATAKDAGKMESPKLTVLSTPPDALTVPENAPAHRKIKHIVIIFSSPTPLAISFNFSPKETFRFCKNATHNAIKKHTIAGVL